jgi:hypothetical protein
MTLSRPLPAVAAGLSAAIVLLATACGTFQISVEGTETVQSLLTVATDADTATPPGPAKTPTPSLAPYRGDQTEAVAWYGQVHSVDRADPGYDYLKPWHLSLFPKFGRAVGLTGIDPAMNAEIDRIRDRDVRAHFWGSLTCGVGDYGACQLMVDRLSANDGGPSFAPDPVEGWLGVVGRLPGQPGSQNETLFVLAGEVPVLYSIHSDDPTIQSELEELQDRDGSIRIWGELHSRVHPVTGSQIMADRLEIVRATATP